ncbi:MAG: endonuclease/exonuclease/phosphatase family protein, partial [Sphingobacteriales bacterium]
SKQAELLSREITRSPYPLVVSGDLNDVPSSYAYLSVRGKLNDTFLEQGAGLGKTFMSGRSRFLTWLPTLRIDYIFTDQSIDVNQFSMTNGSLSDHRGVISDFQLPKKQ